MCEAWLVTVVTACCDGQGGVSHLFMSAEHVANGWGASESLVDLHRGTTGIGEHSLHTLSFQSLHEDVTALPGLVAIPVLPLLCKNPPGQPPSLPTQLNLMKQHDMLVGPLSWSKRSAERLKEAGAPSTAGRPSVSVTPTCNIDLRSSGNSSCEC